MFKRILVPLDGSLRAEQALPLAAHIARIYKSTIVLARIVDTFEMIGTASMQAATLANEIKDVQEQEAQQYLQRICHSGTLQQVETSIEIHVGDIASTLLEMITEQSIDLVIMTDHGHTNYTQWMLGSVAQKIVHNSPAPIFIQRATYPFSFDTSARELKFCITLDGSELAEAIILPTLYLAAACANPQQREIHLLRVVKTLDTDRIETFLKIHKRNMQKFLYDEANDYLKEVCERLNKDSATRLGVHVSWSVSLGRDIAHTIIREVEGASSLQCTPLPYALLALATHARWTEGSVAEHVFHNTKLPLLAICPPTKAKQPAPATDFCSSGEPAWVLA